MDTEAKIILDDTISFCKRDGRNARLINMLAQSAPVELTEESLTIEAPSRFAYSYLMKQREVIERYLEDIAFCPLSLIVTVDQGLTGRVEAEQSTYVSRETTTQDAGGSAPAEPLRKTPIPAVIIPSRHDDEDDKGKVKVRNTITLDDFQKLTGLMQREETGPAKAEESSRDEGRSKPQAVGIHSKFTFENFVYGDENKHAYMSAVRFAALADEPGSCTSLFIYGKSGLGKTHLLLAITNYLNEHSPHLRVKYANSQTYVEDYITELSVQKHKAGVILRDYHDADVLIIDDIQNIIGKSQSIENFFTLMDEFIRNNKKVAIASDRAPKNLGMDERLTSRFNAGMLCLVSEPGFEMKYMILKRYYENTILHGSDTLAGTEAGSLLTSLNVGGGKLTDAQLKHMADVSGTNIRELESFCERCAGVSYEREQAGSELTGEDIDRIANEYFDTAHKKIHIDTVQAVVEKYFHVSHEDLIGPRRPANIALARHVAVYLAMDMCEMTAVAVGEEFGGRDHSTVLNSIKVIEKKAKEDRNLCEDLQQLRNKIRLSS